METFEVGTIEILQIGGSADIAGEKPRRSSQF